MDPKEAHRLDFDRWMKDHGYGASWRPSSPQGERELRKLCARLNPFAVEYRAAREAATQYQQEQGASPTKTPQSGYSPNSIWDKAGQLLPVEECGGGKSQDFSGLHKPPLPEGFVCSRPVARKTGLLP